MSAITFDTELLSAQAMPGTGSADTAASSARKPGLFTRMEAIGRAYSVELPNGDVILVQPF